MRKGGVQRVPTEARAFHSCGELAHAGKRRELAKILGRWGVGCGGERLVYPPVERLDRSFVHPFNCFGHEGRRCGGDRTAAPFETDVLDTVAIELQRDGELVAAQRVVAVGGGVTRVEATEIAGALVVIEDHIAIEVFEVHQLNTSWACRRAATS